MEEILPYVCLDRRSFNGGGSSRTFRGVVQRTTYPPTCPFVALAEMEARRAYEEDGWTLISKIEIQIGIGIEIGIGIGKRELSGTQDIRNINRGTMRPHSSFMDKKGLEISAQMTTASNVQNKGLIWLEARTLAQKT